jgi:adenylate cyclase
MKFKTWKSVMVQWLVSLGIGVFCALLFVLGVFGSWQWQLSDKLFLPKEPSPEIAIIAIDNGSIQALGRWPWPRSIHARLIDILATAQPKVIGLDVAFPEPSPDDEQLAAALKKVRAVLPAEAIGVQLFKSEEINGVVAESILKSHLADYSANLGLTNLPADSDGVVRHVPIAIYFIEHDIEYSFFYKILTAFFGSRDDIYKDYLDEYHRLRINFAGPPGTFETFSYNDVLTGKVSPEIFENKIVLIGATAPDLHDEQLVPTSNGRPMSGVEIHANIIQTVLTRDFLREIPVARMAGLIALLALFCGFLFERLRPAKGLAAAAILIIVYVVTALVAFEYGWILNLLYPLAIIGLVYVAVLILKYLSEVKERRRLRRVFSQYVSPAVVEEVLALPELKLGGAKKTLTVFFSDIRSFTSIAEKLTPEKLVHVLNEYLTAMTDLVFKHRGVVDKYMGDAIMAFWGAPLPDENHAYHTCLCSLAMVEKLKEKFDFKIGIGINTGEMVVGNMGSHERFDYTVMGDNVNLGSRLEGLNKEYGSGIIFSQFTLAELKKTNQEKNLVYRFLDRVAVKGKNEPVEIYELMGLSTDTRWADLADKYQRAIEIFQQNNFSEAKRLFAEVLAKYPADGPTRFYLDRIDKILSGEIKDWDGVNRMKTK